MYVFSFARLRVSTYTFVRSLSIFLFTANATSTDARLLAERLQMWFSVYVCEMLLFQSLLLFLNKKKRIALAHSLAANRSWAECSSLVFRLVARVRFRKNAFISFFLTVLLMKKADARINNFSAKIDRGNYTCTLANLMLRHF